MKTLYFEAAGCYILHNDVESGRIRTAFTNRDGKKVYIELICGCKSLAIKKEDKSGKDMREKWIIKSEYGYMFCDSCHYITDDPKINDCMESRLPCERNLYIEKVKYTKENILNFVNTYCNADFEEVVVLHNLAGYRVFSDCQKKGTSAAYRYGDEFPYDAELTLKRRKKVEEMKKEFCELFHQQRDNTSYWVDDLGQLNVKINTYQTALDAAGPRADISLWRYKKMKKRKITYCYLMERKSDGKKFVTFGNFREAWNKPASLYDFVTKMYPYPQETPFGLCAHISNGLRCDRELFKVIQQAAL